MNVGIGLIAKDENMHSPCFADGKLIETQNEDYVVYTTQFFKNITIGY
jgi:hypothetical protein